MASASAQTCRAASRTPVLRCVSPRCVSARARSNRLPISRSSATARKKQAVASVWLPSRCQTNPSVSQVPASPGE